MTRTLRLSAFAALAAAVAPAARATVAPEVAQKLYDRVTPSLVVVKYTWDGEAGRQEVSGAGVVVNDNGLVMTTMGIVPLVVPDAQIKDFKVVIPSQEKDPEELDAEFQGRDERTGLAFVRVKPSGEAKREWKPLKFEEAPARVGESVLSVGLLPENAAYKTYFTEASVSANLRGETPMTLVYAGGLGVVGSPVFNADGKAIGVVGVQQAQNVFLNDTGNNLAAVTNPPKFFTPTRDFAQSLEDPPAADKPIRLSWLGVPQLTGLNKDVAEVYGLTNQPAAQIGEILPETPAAKAGLKQGDVIVKMNGRPLERGDEPAEVPAMLNRKILRMKPGEEVTLSVMRKRNTPLEDVKVTLAEQPAKPNTAKRFWAEDLGFAARELTFWDTYARHLAADTKGVAVALVKPQSSAQSGNLRREDLITQLNAQPVTDVEQFKTAYQAARKEKPRDAVVLVIRRGGREDTVRIEPPQ